MEKTIEELLQEVQALKQENESLKVLFQKDSLKQKETEQELKESEARWQFALEGAGDGVWDWNAKTNKVFFSKRWKSMLGYEEQEIGDSIEEWENRVHPEDILKCNEDLEKHFSGKTPFYKNEHRVLCKDGSYRWILDRGKVTQWDENGKPLRMIGTHTDITEKKLAEEKLKEAEARWQFALYASGNSVWDWNAQTNKVYYSRQWKISLGYEEHEVGDSLEEWDKRVHPDYKKQCYEELEKHFRGEKPFYQYEYPIQCKDSSYKWILDRGKVIQWTEDGKPLRVIGINTDITERKNLEVSLIESEARFKSLFEKSSSIMLIIDPESGAIVDANTAASNFYGYIREQLCSMNIGDINILPPEEMIKERQKAAQEKKNYFIFPHKLSNGMIRIMEVYSSPISFQKKTVLFSIIHDITERIEREKDVQHLSIERKTILDNIGTGIFLLKDRKVVWSNSRAAEIFGYEPKSVIGMSTEHFHISQNAYIEFGKDAYPKLLEGLQYKTEIKCKRKSGEEFWCEMIGKAILPKHPEEGYIWIMNDITERKNAEILIQQKNKELMELNITKDKFFSIIAHDLRSPFNGFIGFTQIMAEEADEMSTEEIKEISRDMYKAAKDLFELLENLLTWSRIQKGTINYTPTSLNLKKIVLENVNILKEPMKQKSIEVMYNIPEYQEVVADLPMVNTIFRNLLSNAIKFTHKNGRIYIFTEEREKEILISIQDTGIGMSEKILSNLFKIDQKVSRPGTEGESSSGLGLLLCKEFIEKHNGKIWVESQDGKGSIFRLTLPKR